MSKSFTAFAPATVANVASGFDILGFAIEGVGDEVTVSNDIQSGVVIEAIEGLSLPSSIALDPKQNTAGVPLLKMLEVAKPGFGFKVRIKKGIPLGSGMGGSAASAVGAVVAANAVLGNPFNKEQLLEFALEGEAVASGSKHADNIAPCLYGGLTLSKPGDHPDVVTLPVPENLFCVLVHPDLELKTKEARAVLKKEISMKLHSEQSAYLAALIAGFCQSDMKLIARGLQDVVVEPARAPLIPGFHAVKKAALEAGALGCSISGAGPSVFAFTDDEAKAQEMKTAMQNAFQSAGNLPSQAWISRISKTGAQAR